MTSYSFKFYIYSWQCKYDATQSKGKLQISLLRILLNTSLGFYVRGLTCINCSRILQIQRLWPGRLSKICYEVWTHWISVRYEFIFSLLTHSWTKTQRDPSIYVYIQRKDSKYILKSKPCLERYLYLLWMCLWVLNWILHLWELSIQYSVDAHFWQKKVQTKNRMFKVRSREPP